MSSILRSSATCLVVAIAGNLAAGQSSVPAARAATSQALPPGTSSLVGGANDCAAAEAITGQGAFAFDLTGATTGAQGQSNAICLFVGQTGIANDVWFDWTAPATGTARVTTCGFASIDTKIAVYAGSGCPAGGPLVCNDDACGLRSSVTFPCVAGSHYTIQLGVFPGSGVGTGSFTITLPSADTCGSPQAISGFGPFAFELNSATTGAEGQLDGLCLATGTTGIANDVWYDWTAPATGVARVSTCGSAAIDTKVAVYAGAGCPGGPALACNDDTCGLQSVVTFNCTAGSHYTIQLGVFPGSTTGTGTFAVFPIVPPANDSCATPTAIAGENTFPFANNLATTGIEGQAEALCFAVGTSGIAADVWFDWTAPATGMATLQTCSGAAFDTKLAVYAGAGCPAGPALACNDDACGLQSSLRFACVAGEHYTLQIGSFPGAAVGAGNFRISVAEPCPLEIVSDPAGVMEGNGPARFPALSFDGTFVAFESAASNLVLPDTVGSWDVFVRNRGTGAIEMISRAFGGGQANGNSHFPDISTTGRYVVFESLANNLAGTDLNNVSDIYRYDRTLGSMLHVSEGGNQPSYKPVISDDGRYVAFESYATFGVEVPDNNRFDVFVKDLVTNTVVLCSRPNAGGVSNGESRNPAISGNGRFIAFESRATNLTGDTTSNEDDIYIFDRLAPAGSQLRHVKAPSGDPLNGRALKPSLSYDGNWLAFDTTATNLPSPAVLGGGIAQVFLLNRSTLEFTHVSRVLLPAPITFIPTWFKGNADSRNAVLSADGNRMAFYSFAENLLPGDLNLQSDVFTWERATATIDRITHGPLNVQSDANAAGTAISGTGTVVGWFTAASTLLPAGTDTNTFEDVYVQNCAGTFAGFCFGDGSSLPCPCSPAPVAHGAPGNGCPNSLNPAGASLTAAGVPSLLVDTVVLQSSGTPGGFALFFQGTAQAGIGGAGTAFGDGKRCATGTVTRLGLKAISGGLARYPGTGDAPVSVVGNVLAPTTLYYQCWYRNPASFCTPEGFNLTNGLTIVWVM